VKEQNILKKTDNTKSIVYPYFVNEINSSELNSIVDSSIKSMEFDCNNFLWIIDYEITKNTSTLLIIKFSYKVTINSISSRYLRYREVYVDTKSNRIVKSVDMES
jgi:hypothetical protein